MHVYVSYMYACTSNVCASILVSLYTCRALRHSSGWRTCLQERAGGAVVVVVAQSVFIHHQGPPTCTRIPTQQQQQHSDTLGLKHHLNSTSLHSILTCSPQLHRCCLPLLSTPQAATTSANRKRDAPSPRTNQHLVVPCTSSAARLHRLE